MEQPDSGRITLGEQVLFDSASHVDRPVNRRGLAMVFQSYAIWPHMSVFQDAAFPLQVSPRRSRPSGKQIRERVERALQTVGPDRFGERSVRAVMVVVHELSQHPSEMTLADHDDVIETLPADCRHEPFCE